MTTVEAPDIAAAEPAWADLWDGGAGYLDTATYGLPSRTTWATLQAALEDWRVGRGRWEEWSTSTETARASFARLTHAAVENVTVGATVSELIGLVAAALPDGSRVLAPSEEFTSNLFPYLQQADHGVVVDTVATAELAEAIDERMTLVAFSVVQSRTGEVADVDAIVRRAREHGALVVADATQSFPWVDIRAAELDAYVCTAYKWLMSPRGSALMVTSPALRERMRPVSAGWFAGADVHTSYYGPPLRLASDARRFDVSPAWFSWIGASASLEVVEQLGVGAIAAHNVGLANQVRAGLGLAPSNSAIVIADVPDAASRLDAAGIRAGVRGGRVRMSFHVYNTPADADLVVEALSSGR